MHCHLVLLINSLLRLLKLFFDNVLLEHGGLPHVLLNAAHLFFGAEQVEGGMLSHLYS